MMTLTAARHCRAHNRLGQACRRRPIVGGNVCHSHGGAARQVKKAARERLAEIVDLAITELARLIKHADSDAVKLAAVKDLLDRAGYKPAERLEESGRLTIEVVYTDTQLPENGALVNLMRNLGGGS